MLVNIVDKRTNSYAFKQITAICEPAWHDNTVQGADRIDRELPRDDSWSYDELPITTLEEALDWAKNKPGKTTLYLYDLGDGINIVDGAHVGVSVDAPENDRRERATILAALRYWQRKTSMSNSDSTQEQIIATDGGTLEQLDYDEVEALCDKLNRGGR